MVATNNYNRPKLVGINVTPMLTTIKAAEKPDAPTAFGAGADTGTSGELDALFQLDADESGGVDVQTVFQLEALPVIGDDGKMSLQVTITPVNGDATDGTPEVFTVVHGENCDGWQVAAGRARQA